MVRWFFFISLYRDVFQHHGYFDVLVCRFPKTWPKYPLMIFIITDVIGTLLKTSSLVMILFDLMFSSLRKHLLSNTLETSSFCSVYLVVFHVPEQQKRTSLILLLKFLILVSVFIPLTSKCLKSFRNAPLALPSLFLMSTEQSPSLNSTLSR